ncbi:TPA: hypothetical protein KC803_005360, partial [Escherichia coli O146]|nr:hypothetical protein [Escherichia coli O146]
MMQPQHVHDSTSAAGATTSPADTATAVHTAGTPARTGAAAKPVIADCIRDALEALRRDVVEGKASPYLAGKGLEGFATKFPVLEDGRALILMQDASNIITAYQTISADGKEKRFTG